MIKMKNVIEKLADIETIRLRIKHSKSSTIISLYKFIYEEEGGRAQENRLRNFKGFAFEEKFTEYEKKAQYVNEQLTGTDLINCCKILGLQEDGKKKCLMKRIFKGLMDINTLAVAPNNQHNTKITEIDMNVSIQHFNGSDAYPVERWLTDIEEVSTLLKLTEEQKVILAKMLLIGLAKMWIKDRDNIKTWGNLKTVLKELSNEINNSHLHEDLANRKMRNNEKVQDYYIAMKKLAQDKIKPETLIQYVINGIPDDTNNKAILYGAKNLEDFSTKLKLYETIGKE